MFQDLHVQSILPDVFEVAAGSWGIEMLHPSLIPLSFALTLSFFFFILSASSIFRETGTGRFACALCSLMMFLFAFSLALRGVQFVSFSTMFLFFYGTIVVGALSLFLYHVLVFMRVRLPVASKVLLLISLSLGGAGFFALWVVGGTQAKQESILFISESLIFLSVALIGFLGNFLYSKERISSAT